MVRRFNLGSLHSSQLPMVSSMLQAVLTSHNRMEGGKNNPYSKGLAPQDPNLTFLSYRNTPGVYGFSPAQVLIGRQLRTRVPKGEEQLSPNWPPRNKATSRNVAYKKQHNSDHNRRHAVRDLPSLRAGEQV